MALPIPGFYTSTGGTITTHDFGSVEAGEYKPDSTGWSFRLYNAKGSTDSDPMTSVKMSIRDTDGGIDEIWTQQHWIQVKSYGSSTGTGMVDDAQTVFTAVGKNKELSLGDIPSGEYRTLYARCYPPTDAAEQDVDFQLRATYQDPATSICNWITGLRGNGVVASTGTPFVMSTGGTSGTIPYDAGYALIYNNEIYYGSSGSYDITTTGSGTYKIYLNESGAFGETTGSVAANQLELYEATISSGVCTAVVDKRVYLAGLQSGTTGAMPTTPDLGDLYLDTTGGKLYAAKTAGNWTVIVPGATFVALTDTPANYTDDASKILTVTTGEDEVEFTSSTGIALDSFGTPSTGTSLNATTGRHGLLPILSGSSGEYLDGDGNFAVPKASDVEISEIGTATYDDVQDWLNNVQSGGIISGGTIADDSSGGITISSGTGIIKTTTGDIGLTKSFDWSAGAIVSTGLTDGSANYIYMDYNATGSPQILATADRTTIRLQDQFTMGRIYKSSGDLHILNTGVKMYNFARREHERLVTIRHFERASGGEITESDTTERALDSTIGNFYLGLNRVTTTAKDTSTGGSDYFTSWYYINSAWTSSTGQQQIDDDKWNDTSATGLKELGVGRYGVHWTYIHFDGDIQTVYGQGNYTLAQAEIATIPDSLPSAVDDFSTLAAKIILQKTSTGFTSVITAYKQLFPVSSPTEHNDLGGLDTADYQHLTSAEHDEITQWAGAVTLSTGGAVNLVEFSTGGTVNVPSGQEYKINGSEVKLDEWATPTTGTALDTTTGVHGLLPIGDADATHYLAGDISWTSTTGIVLDSLATPTTGTALDTTTGVHGLLPIGDADATHYLAGDISWTSTTGIVLDSLSTPTTGTALNSSTGRHGLLIALDGTTGNYLRGDGTWVTPPAAAGEANTASNAGTTGIGIYYQKAGVDLEFKAIHSTGNILVTDSTGTITVNLDVDSTGIALDSLGTPSTGTSLNATTGVHGLLPIGDADATHYLAGDISWTSTTGIVLDSLATPTTGTALDTTTGVHGLLPIGDADATHYLAGDISWTSTTGIVLDSLATPTTGTALNATTGRHGLLLAFSGTTGEYLSATGGWNTPADTNTFVGLTDTPADYTGDASKLLVVTTGEDAVEFIPSTGIALDTFGTPTDITTNNATTGYHGLLPKRDGNAAHWLDGAGLWTAPTASEVGALESSGAFTVNAIPQITSTGGVLKASVFAVTTGDVFNFGAHSAGFTEQAIAISTGTTAIDWNNGLKALYTRSTGSAGAATFTFTAPVKSANLMLIIRGSTAGSTGVITWPTVYWQGGSVPTLTGTASAIDAVAFYYSTGLTAYLGLGSANFSTV